MEFYFFFYPTTRPFISFVPVSLRPFSSFPFLSPSLLLNIITCSLELRGLDFPLYHQKIFLITYNQNLPVEGEKCLLKTRQTVVVTLVDLKLTAPMKFSSLDIGPHH